jgi:ABC-2 type transport system permease protein
MREITRPLPFAAAARGVFDLALDQMLWSRRSLFMALLLGLPLVFALIFRMFLVAHLPPRMSGFDFYGNLIAFYYVGNVLPLAALFYSTALIADEVEGKTLTYLLTRPITRGAILTGKFAAYLVTTLTFTLPAGVLTFLLLNSGRGVSGLGARVPEMFQDMGVLGLTLLVYGALFTLMGVLLRRPVIPGLLFVMVWEFFVPKLPGYMPRFTLTTWLRSLIQHRPADEGMADAFGDVLPTALSLGVIVGATVVFLVAASWIFSRREYVLEQ